MVRREVLVWYGWGQGFGGGGGVVRYGVWGVGREGCGVVGGFGTVRYGLV